MNPISKIYFGLEDHYYGFCDWLEKTGIKIYEWFVNPIEDRGVPSFPFFIILLAIIIGGAAFFALNFKSPFADTVSMDVAVLSDGQPVDGAQVIVTLQDGKEFTALSKNGIAHFDGLPKDAQANIKVQHPSGKFEKNVVLTGEKIVALLEPLRKSFKVIVANNNGDPVGGAQITFSDPDSGSLQQYSTDATGTAEIVFTNDNALFRLRVTADGFDSQYKSCAPTQQSCQILLSSSNSGSKIETKGSVAVNVKDQQGNPVKDATVSLYNANGYSQVITSAITDVSGSVFFREAIAVGTSVYVGVDADGYASYNGVQNNDVQAVAADKNTEFIVTLSKKSSDGGLPSDYSKVSVIVVDEKDQPISGADVKLFLFTRPLSILGEKQADDSGAASFDVSKDGIFYATAVADGFLPRITRQLKGGEITKISLLSAAAGNNGALEVTVRDADGNYIANANVELTSDDGFNLGYVPQESGSDGIAAFAQVETSKPMRALAVFGSQTGTSDVFQVSSGDTTKVEVDLDRNTAKMLVRAKDYSQSQDAFLNATITAFYKGTAIGSCQSVDSGSYCNITVYANVPITLQANASGFADYASEQITLSTGQELQKTALMLPSDLAKDVVIMNFSAFQMDSLGNTIIDAEHPATSFERGGWYKVLLVVNLPQSQKSGFYLRMGDKPTIAEEKAFIAGFDAPSSDEHAAVDFGTTYNQDSTCAQQSQQQSGNEIKWVNIQYPSGSVGVKTLAVKVRVRPTATTTSRIDLHYRAYAVKNGFWARAPADADLGSKENVAGKQSCFADTIKADYAVTQGFQKCTDKGCITLTLKGNGQSASRFLSVPYGTQVELDADVKAFAPDMTTNPAVKFSTTSDKLDIDRSLNNVELVDGEASASTIANAHAPGNYMPVTAEFYSDEGTIASSNGVLEFTGTGQLVLTVTPSVMQANVPPGNDQFVPIKATLTTGQGRPVTNAIITIEETGDTHPFLGFPNGGDSIIGNGQKDSGKDGVYVFRGVYPKTIGAFHVKADAGSDFEKPVSMDVQVVAGSFLNIDPQDYAFVTQQACENGLQLTLSKNIPVELKKVYYQVSGGSNESQCVEILQPPSSPFSMRKNQDQIDVIVKPILDGTCAATFSSTLEGSGSAAETQANFNVRCNLNPSPSPSGSPTPTPSPTTSACSASNCAACNEQQCVNLQSGGFCKAVYSSSSFSGQVSIEDINSMQFNPGTIVVKPNTAITWKNNGILNHTVTFDADNQTSGVIQPGQTFTFNGFAQKGTYSYHCSIHPQMTGSIIVSDNPSNFLSCQQGNQSNGGGTNKTPDACSIYNFDLGQVLAGRLGYLAGQRLFNPTNNQRAIASSASNQIVHEPFPPFFRTLQTGQGCAPEDGKPNSLLCTKYVSALVPQNGMAVSIKNNIGVDTSVQISRDYNQCFSVKQIDGVGLAKAGDLIQSVVTDSFGLPGKRYATFVVLFDASKADCADYSYDPVTTFTKLTPKPGKDTFKLILSNPQLPQSEFTLTLKVVGIDSKFAVLAAPRLQTGVSNGLFSRVTAPVEPFLIANNVQYRDIAVGKGVVPSKGVNGLGLKLNVSASDPYQLVFQTQNSGAKLNVGSDHIPPETGVAYDVVGNTLVADSYTACSGKDFCYLDKPKDLETDLQKGVSEDLWNVVGNMDSVSYSQAYDFDRILLEQATTDALQEYFASLISYQICKATGPDPLQNVVNRCNSIRQNPLGAQNMGDAFSTGFTAAACDSEVLNIAYSATRGAVSYPPGYLQQLSRRLVQQYFMPGRTDYPFGQRIYQGLNTTINVPVKIAGTNGGYTIYSFQPDMKASTRTHLNILPDSVYYPSFGSQQCDPRNPYQNGMYCMPYGGYGAPLYGGQGYGPGNGYGGGQQQGMGAYIPFNNGVGMGYNGFQNFGGTNGVIRDRPNDNGQTQELVYLKGTYGFKNFQTASTAKDFTSVSDYGDGVPFVSRPGDKTGIKADSHAPNLYTMNKYGFDGSVDMKVSVDQPPGIVPGENNILPMLAAPPFDQNAAFKNVFEKHLKDQLFEEKAVKVQIVDGNDNSISIAPIAGSPSASPSVSPSASPSPGVSPSPSPSPNGGSGFQNTETGLPDGWTARNVGGSVVSEPQFLVTVKINFERDITKPVVDGKPNVDYVSENENIEENSPLQNENVILDRRDSLTAVLDYLLHENYELDCRDANGQRIMPKFTSEKLMENIPDNCKAIEHPVTQTLVPEAQRNTTIVLPPIEPKANKTQTETTVQAGAWQELVQIKSLDYTDGNLYKNPKMLVQNSKTPTSISVTDFKTKARGTPISDWPFSYDFPFLFSTSYLNSINAKTTAQNAQSVSISLSDIAGGRFSDLVNRNPNSNDPVAQVLVAYGEDTGRSTQTCPTPDILLNNKVYVCTKDNTNAVKCVNSCFAGSGTTCDENALLDQTLFGLLAPLGPTNSIPMCLLQTPASSYFCALNVNDFQQKPIVLDKSKTYWIKIYVNKKDKNQNGGQPAIPLDDIAQCVELKYVQQGGHQ